jgi:hypothetical protein
MKLAILRAAVGVAGADQVAEHIVGRRLAIFFGAVEDEAVELADRPGEGELGVLVVGRIIAVDHRIRPQLEPGEFRSRHAELVGDDVDRDFGRQLGAELDLAAVDHPVDQPIDHVGEIIPHLLDPRDREHLVDQRAVKRVEGRIGDHQRVGRQHAMFAVDRVDLVLIGPLGDQQPAGDAGVGRRVERDRPDLVITDDDPCLARLVPVDRPVLAQRGICRERAALNRGIGETDRRLCRHAHPLGAGMPRPPGP